MAYLSVFQNPFAHSVQVQLHQAAHQAAFQQPGFMQVAGPQHVYHQVAIPQPMFMQIAVQPSIAYVGCVIIAKGRHGSPHGTRDIIMPFSHTKNAYDVLGGDVSGGNDPRKCMNTLMSQFGIHVEHHTKYVDVTNDSNGKLCRIYIVNLGDISVTQLTQRIVYNPVLSGAYAHLNRFPLNGPTNTHTNVDSNGQPKAFLSFASKIMKIAKQS